MFARKVAARLRPNSLAEFANLMEFEVLPWLRTQKGFLDLIILSASDGTEIATISFWDHKENAREYDSSGCPMVLKKLAGLLDGTPYVKTFEVINSTIHANGESRKYG
jgi:heme-degrading monooxygenase HmoA